MLQASILGMRLHKKDGDISFCAQVSLFHLFLAAYPQPVCARLAADPKRVACGSGTFCCIAHVKGLLKPSVPHCSQVALDFIGKRGSTVGVAKPARIEYAKSILQRELLPHLGIEEYCETKKVSLYLYFVNHPGLKPPSQKLQSCCR